MLQNIFNTTSLLPFKWNLYTTDIFDILLVAILIYTFFIFIRKTRTYTVFFGLAIAAALYLISKTFNLYLTFITLRYFVGVSLIIFVIIFQSEIRKYFEFLGFMGSRQLKVGRLAPKSPLTAEIVQACVQMAQSKTGALIVIQGKDNLDTLTDGGTNLDGVISEDIIMSIFDPHSDGHDGALVIKNNRITKFGTHLPLSTNFKELGKHGTRHSAALGLSENSDAFSIICSEEKGKISICKEGKMKTLLQYTDLEKELDKFIKDKFSFKSQNKIDGWIKHDFWLKIGALLTAVIVWFFTAYQAGIVEKTFSVPITIDRLPKDILIESYNPKEIKVTVSGRGDSTFSELSPEDFKVIYNATVLDNGVSKEELTKKNLVIPSNLSLINFDPSSFLITAQKYILKEVPVRAEVKNEPKEDYSLSKVEITPDTVEIWVPVGEESPTELSTENIDVSEQTESVIIPAKLIIPEGIRLFNGDEFINIALTVEKEN